MVKKQGVEKQTKNELGYEFIIDVNKITISEFLKQLGSKIDITDVEIENENIDNTIIKLYRNFNI